jgi:hypothetical protein
MSEATNLYAVKSVIRIIRNQRVILDSDLAKLYGVPAKRLNEAVKRNSKRFPADFMFQLDAHESTRLKSQIATSSSKHRGTTYLPYALSVPPSRIRLRRTAQTLNAQRLTLNSQFNNVRSPGHA